MRRTLVALSLVAIIATSCAKKAEEPAISSEPTRTEFLAELKPNDVLVKTDSVYLEPAGAWGTIERYTPTTYNHILGRRDKVEKMYDNNFDIEILVEGKSKVRKYATGVVFKHEFALDNNTYRNLANYIIKGTEIPKLKGPED